MPRLLCCHDVTELFMLDFELLNLELLLLKKRRKGSWKNRRIPAEVLSSRMRKGERFKRLCGMVVSARRACLNIS